MNDEIEDTSPDVQNETDDLQPTSDENIIKIAKQRFQLAAEAEAENRRDELDDLHFIIGDQWPLDIRNSRMQDQRPCLTINRLPQFVRQITNDQRQNRPAIKVNPVDDAADIDTAKILQGMVRHIEYSSHADIAYDTAFEFAAKSGLGYFRICREYADPLSFQQEIKIKRIKDRFSVYLDPYYQEPDGSDARWGFVFEDMSKDEFREQYPDSKLASMSDWVSIGDSSALFIKKDTVRIAEYYYKEYEETDIVLLSNKKTFEKKNLPEQLPDDLRIVSERRTLLPKIKWCKINGLEILDRTDEPGEWVPIIPVIGEEDVVEGKRVIAGIIRNAKDSQRMYNYWASAETETIALAPRAPFIGAEGQFEGYEDIWKTANTKNHAFLQYKLKSLNGVPAPPPQRASYEPAVQAITQARAQSADDLKATTGIYDASLGNRSNEESGIAIQRRNHQAQVSNFHFIDNLSRSLRHAGRILINWIPKVYDTAQFVRVIGDDGEVSMVQINQIFQEGGEEKSHFLDHGLYDVTVDTGPSYQTKRQEAVASMLDLLRSAPGLMNVSGDLLVRNMDWPGASEIADRIKKTLPPNIVEDKKDQKPLPPQVQAMLQQQSAMIQGLTKELSENSEIIRTKRLELESKERIALGEQQTQLSIELIKHDAAQAKTIFAAELAEIDKRRALVNNDQPIGNGAGGQMPAEDPSQIQQQPTAGGPPLGG